ncbi:hypothetical protein DPMN_097221 [Dreissena polymorpha]|uniref:Uncharacterized protein n=1 Tax=Dreissena polymorpha TaxID=45954 RepID=A0A9D4LBD4_DREPO|nr:hypothetical protein DPMN_097221 [Dreissena polymorpha]
MSSNYFKTDEMGSKSLFNLPPILRQTAWDIVWLIQVPKCARWPTTNSRDVCEVTPERRHMPLKTAFEVGTIRVRLCCCLRQCACRLELRTLKRYTRGSKDPFGIV